MATIRERASAPMWPSSSPACRSRPDPRPNRASFRCQRESRPKGAPSRKAPTMRSRSSLPERSKPAANRWQESRQSPHAVGVACLGKEGGHLLRTGPQHAPCPGRVLEKKGRPLVRKSLENLPDDPGGPQDGGGPVPSPGRSGMKHETVCLEKVRRPQLLFEGDPGFFRDDRILGGDVDEIAGVNIDAGNGRRLPCAMVGGKGVRVRQVELPAPGRVGEDLDRVDAQGFSAPEDPVEAPGDRDVKAEPERLSGSAERCVRIQEGLTCPGAAPSDAASSFHDASSSSAATVSWPSRTDPRSKHGAPRKSWSDRRA